MSTPSASSNVPGHLAFSPGRATPQCSPGNGNVDWGPGQPIPLFGAASRDDIDSPEDEKEASNFGFWYLQTQNIESSCYQKDI
eukprot:5766121-Prorocentrum_lima.AAC.1